LSDLQGDIDTLLARMAFIRTWTYITHHTRWLEDAQAWQEQARTLEDELSDALHEKLVRRFVDATARRNGHRPAPRGAFAQQLQEAMAASPDAYPEVSVNPDVWVDSMVEATDERFGLGEGTQIVGDGRVLGRMSRGTDRLRPEISVILDELGPGAKLRLQRRLVAWTRDLAAALLEPLRDPQLTKLGPAARGIVYQLERGMGTALARDAQEQLGQIDAADRSRLGRAGIRLGRHVLYCAPLLKSEAMQVRAAFCEASLAPGIRVTNGHRGARFLLPVDAVDDETYLAMGYPVFGGVAIRADEVEALAKRIAGGAREQAVASHLGCDLEVAGAVVDALYERRRRR
jgi:ATP-dependent RNA helicase SUPV3L1/SUV3